MSAVTLVGTLVTSLTLTACAFSTDATAATHGTVWLCKPGALSNPCTVNPDVSVVSSSGAATLSHRIDAVTTKFDCFYVYPTVSSESGANADLKIQPAEVNVAFAQASAFSQICHVWAPMYRQRTLGSLFRGHENYANNVAYASVLSAWKEYLARDNHGRPVILIGHSQGAAMLIRLIASQFDHSATLRVKLVSALLLGGNVTVKDGLTLGGSFQRVPTCSRAPTLIGCVIAYSTFPVQPPPTSFFGIAGQGVSTLSGQSASAGLSVACVNPVDLSGVSATSAVSLSAQFPATTVASVPSISVATAWVQYRDLYSAQCKRAGNVTWLQVNATPSLNDVRPLVSELVGSNWGFHVDDVALALGDLVSTAANQEAAYLAVHPHAP